jgi:hypothetical protein
VRGEVVTHVVSTDADHHRVEAGKLLGREVRAAESSDLVAHFLEGFGNLVACAGDVADATAFDCNVEDDRFETREGLQQLLGDMGVTDDDAAGVPRPVADAGLRGEYGCGRRGRRLDVER